MSQQVSKKRVLIIVENQAVPLDPCVVGSPVAF